ncbi:MAG: undecaprenyl-diphosphate phosphatase [Candidatus Heimdallarchaeota archaeon]|nr:undecaprenyl-diphosphate phosphatase [Candidatus Heimdallarchaeota archaeon]
MLFWILLLLASLQGIIEWLPVSSEGQIIIVSNLLNIDSDSALDLALWLHLGTLIAVSIKYYKDIYLYFNPKISDPIIVKWRWFLLLSTIGTIIVGVLCYILVRYVTIDPAIGEYVMLIVGIALLITAGLLFYAKRQQKTGKKIEDLSKKEMTSIGLLQGFSIIPGISRSGITLSGLLFMSVDKDEAIKGSFIMSIPAVMGGFILNLLDKLIKNENIFPADWWMIIIAIIVTAVLGYLTMELFIRIARKYNFAAICVVLGLLTIILFALRWLPS